ncbi:Ppx/GppA phosphatase family protein [uncultured Fusobacterium sp.]|jgi:exopolyphosphatase/guanosine-5'-triphosphate,3'-diphosphate pyrophosphatase|uniref:Ppx/GppA phosphatase family protein n=1 Tax=uncultured Fusobacterium sp. TaxID=159267 RepID=UPI0025F24281|nr:Ppx/GppA phosphatase family protein [uncultured Fusobacterium sp.]MCF2638977.1 Ppx/GppA family phosphatase [Fusobacterium varium]
MYQGKNIKGIIDIGTNSCRLFIAELENTSEGKKIKRELVKDVEIVKLGEGVNKTHNLNPNAIKRTLDCLKKYKEKASSYGVENIRAFATSAVRDAENRDIFLQEVSKLGIKIECISGKTEATLNFLGNSLVFKDRILVVDIGGGSTEFTLGKDKSIDFIQSINIGAVRATEKFFSDNDYSEEKLEKCKAWIRKNLEILKNIKDRDFKLIGVAGTATTQISVRDKMEIYDSSKVHMATLTLDELKENLSLFLSKNFEERKNIIGLEEKRADVIIAGTLILLTILEELNQDKIIISESDNLSGAITREEETMSERLEWIMEAYESFRKSSGRRLIAGNIFDYFMQDFRGEMADAYDIATKEEIKEDIKTLADIIYQEEDKHKREFLVEILVNLVKMLG